MIKFDESSHHRDLPSDIGKTIDESYSKLEGITLEVLNQVCDHLSTLNGIVNGARVFPLENRRQGYIMRTHYSSRNINVHARSYGISVKSYGIINLSTIWNELRDEQINTIINE